MDPSLQEIIENMMNRLADLPCVEAKDLPYIDLYMDQVTTLMEEKLSPTRRNESDKILTKTMINNYAKNHLLPPPVKKKYAREHMYLLILIYYFKGFLSLQDIRKVIEPLTKDIAAGSRRFDLDQIFGAITALQQDLLPETSESLRSMLEKSEAVAGNLQSLSKERTSDTADADSAYLQVLSVICALATDVFVKKRIIEELIDSCL